MQKKKLVTLPKKVYKVILDKSNFDYLFLEFLRDNPPEEAYEKALELVRKYAPKFKHYKDYSSYRSRRWKQNDDTVQIPSEIIEAATNNIDKLMHKHLKELKVRKMAYDATVRELQKWLPDYKPYANYQAFRSAMTIRHKKRKK